MQNNQEDWQFPYVQTVEQQNQVDNTKINRLQIQYRIKNIRNSVRQIKINSQIQELNKELNQISFLQIKYLTKSSYPLLQQVNLNCNLIGSAGIQHLTKAYWSNLTLLCLTQNFIQFYDIQVLSSLKCQKIRWFYFDQLQKIGELSFVRFKCPKLTHIYGLYGQDVKKCLKNAFVNLHLDHV